MTSKFSKPSSDGAARVGANEPSSRGGTPAHQEICGTKPDLPTKLTPNAPTSNLLLEMLQNWHRIPPQQQANMLELLDQLSTKEME